MAKKKITIEYGAMSSRYSINAENKHTAYAAILSHYRNSPHLVMLYEPKEEISEDIWFNIEGKISDRLDDIFKDFGGFDKYFLNNAEDIINAYRTIKQII